MDDRKLDELLKSYAKAPVPALPGAFPQNVLREIRLRAADAHPAESWLTELYALFFRPRLLAASFTMAVIVGLVLPVMMGPPNSATAASSLGLEVFSHSMSQLPSGLLAKAQ